MRLYKATMRYRMGTQCRTIQKHKLQLVITEFLIICNGLLSLSLNNGLTFDLHNLITYSLYKGNISRITLSSHSESITETSIQRGPILNKQIQDLWQIMGLSPKTKQPERRIILMGKTGSGKSATGKNILKQDVFPSGVGISSLTKKSTLGKVNRSNRNIKIIDTPSIWHTHKPTVQVKEELLRGLRLAVPGPHVFLLVVPLRRFTKEDQMTVKLLKTIYGEDLMKFTIVLFTQKDNLREKSSTIKTLILTFLRGSEHNGVETIEKCIQTAPLPLTRLLNECGNRFVAFNNNGSVWERNDDVSRLFEIVDEVVEQNENKCYTNMFLRTVEEETKKQERKLQRRILREKRISSWIMKNKGGHNKEISPTVFQWLVEIVKHLRPVLGFLGQLYIVYKQKVKE